MKNKNKLFTPGVFVAFALIFLISTFVGYILAGLGETLAKDYGFIEYALILLGIFAAVIFSVVTHELGHLFYGWLSGYGFVSFRIFGIILIKLREGLRIKRYSLVGTGGQCLMMPPQVEEGRLPFILYNLGGALFNLFFSGILSILFVLFGRVPVLSHVLIIGAAVSAASAIVNGVPMSVGGIDNDGKNTLSLLKSRRARRAFAIQLSINAEMSLGKGLSEMKDEWFALPDDSEIDNALCATLAVFSMNRLLEEKRFDECRALIKEYLSKDCAILDLHRYLLKLDLLYIDLVTFGDEANAEAFYKKDMQGFIKAMKKFPAILRTQYAVALIKEKNEEKAEKIRQTFYSAVKNYPYEKDAASEEELLLIASERKNRT